MPLWIEHVAQLFRQETQNSCWTRKEMCRILKDETQLLVAFQSVPQWGWLNTLHFKSFSVSVERRAIDRTTVMFLFSFNSGCLSAGVWPSELPGGLSGSMSASGPTAVFAVLPQTLFKPQHKQWQPSKEQPLPQPQEVRHRPSHIPTGRFCSFSSAATQFSDIGAPACYFSCCLLV